MFRPPWNGESIDATTLLGDDSDAFETALDDPDPSRIAVVGEPFGGRSIVLDAAARRLGARRLDLGPDDDPRIAADAVESAPLVIDGCHHLFGRSVGGFEPLTDFLDAVAVADTPVVAGWNSYAWSYLTAIGAVDDDVPTVVTVDGLAADRLTELARRTFESLPTFRRDDLEESLVSIRHVPVRWNLTIPVPVPDREAITARRADRPSPQEAVFERLASVSGGNPGVALALLERCRDGNEIRPSDVCLPAEDIPIDRTAAFCLRIVLATERVRRDRLAERFDGSIDRLLARFAREGLLTRSNGTVSLDPGGLPAAAAITDRRRIL